MGLIIPQRRKDWRTRLTVYLAETDGTKFRAGKHDCALYCAGAVRAMTGFDAARGWRGYKTLSGGAAKLEKGGFSYWWDMLDGRECAAADVRIGDIAVVKSGDDLAGGICLGALVSVVTPQGRGLVPYSDIEKGYRI